VRPDERLDVLLAKVCCIIVLLGVATYTVIRVRPEVQLAGADRFGTLTDLFVLLVALMFVSPVLQPNHALWLLPLLVVRPLGLAWLALPGILSLSYLTHLAGPDAADLTFAGGKLSFRLFEYLLLLGLIAVDMLWRRDLFTEPRGRRAATSRRGQRAGRPRHRPRRPARRRTRARLNAAPISLTRPGGSLYCPDPCSLGGPLRHVVDASASPERS